MYSRRNTGSVNMREEFLRHRMRLEKILDKTATYAITRNDMYGVSQLVLRVSGLSAAATITLPSAADFQDQKITVLLDDDSEYAVTINNSGATKIQELNLNEDSAEYVSDGTNVRQVGGTTLNVITYDQTITIGSGQDMPFAETTWHYLSDVYIREGVTLTADIANATYTLGTTEVIQIINQDSPGVLYITGDPATPSNVTIRIPASYAGSMYSWAGDGWATYHVMQLWGCNNVRIDGILIDCATNANQDVIALHIVNSQGIRLGDDSVDSLRVNVQIPDWVPAVYIVDGSQVLIQGLQVVENSATYDNSIGVAVSSHSKAVVNKLNLDGFTSNNTNTGSMGIYCDVYSRLVLNDAAADVITIDNKYAALVLYGTSNVAVTSGGSCTFTGCRHHWWTNDGHNIGSGDGNITGASGTSDWKDESIGTWSTATHSVVYS